MAGEPTTTTDGERETGTAQATAQSRTALVSIGAAGVLVALKLGTGIFAGSLGLVSAGIGSSGDVVAAVVTFFAIRFGVRRPIGIIRTGTGEPRIWARSARPRS